jgi:hypothetical protein
MRNLVGIEVLGLGLGYHLIVECLLLYLRRMCIVALLPQDKGYRSEDTV